MKNIEAIKTLIESMGITQEELYPVSAPQSDVEDKNWEIVAFKSVQDGDLMSLRNGYYQYDGDSITACTVNDILHGGRCVDSGEFLIWSVKKLSTGEIFTVGDKICWNWTEPTITYFDIVKFSIDEYDGHMRIHTNSNCNGFNLLFMPKWNLRHYIGPVEQKEVLFITEDGIEITDSETLIWSVSDEWEQYTLDIIDNQPIKYKALSNWTLPSGASAHVWHHFSTQKAAQAYIDSKKPKIPLLVTSDGVEIYDAQQILHQFSIKTWKIGKDSVKIILNYIENVKKEWLKLIP